MRAHSDREPPPSGDDRAGNPENKGRLAGRFANAIP